MNDDLTKSRQPADLVAHFCIGDGCPHCRPQCPNCWPEIVRCTIDDDPEVVAAYVEATRRLWASRASK